MSRCSGGMDGRPRRDGWPPAAGWIAARGGHTSRRKRGESRSRHSPTSGLMRRSVWSSGTNASGVSLTRVYDPAVVTFFDPPPAWPLTARAGTAAWYQRPSVGSTISSLAVPASKFGKHAGYASQFLFLDEPDVSVASLMSALRPRARGDLGGRASRQHHQVRSRRYPADRIRPGILPSETGRAHPHLLVGHNLLLERLTGQPVPEVAQEVACEA